MWGGDAGPHSSSFSIHIGLQRKSKPSCKKGFVAKCFTFNKTVCFLKSFLPGFSCHQPLAKLMCHFQCLTLQNGSSRFDSRLLGTNLCRFTKSFHFEELCTSKDELSFSLSRSHSCLCQHQVFCKQNVTKSMGKTRSLRALNRGGILGGKKGNMVVEYRSAVPWHIGDAAKFPRFLYAFFSLLLQPLWFCLFVCTV